MTGRSGTGLLTDHYELTMLRAALGSAATHRFPALAEARPFMQHLARDTGLACIAWDAEAAQIVVLESYGLLDPFGPSIGVGRRSPFAPPFGVSYVGWLTPREFDDWLARGDPPVTTNEIPLLRKAISFVAIHGYLVTLHTAAEQWLREITRAEGDPTTAFQLVIADAMQRLRERETYLVPELDADTLYPVGTITAPVFGTNGRPVLGVLLQGFRSELTGREIDLLGRKVVQAAQRITTAVGGHSPEFRSAFQRPTTLEPAADHEARRASESSAPPRLRQPRPRPRPS
jgi:DNA-binding IclR family transcriptional regulator